MQNKNRKKISLKSIFSLLLIISMIIIPILLIQNDINITRGLVIIFWLLLSLNILFIILVTISRLSNEFIMTRYYEYLFNKIYDKKLSFKTNKELVDIVLKFFKDNENNMDFKRERIRLKEIVDSSYEINAFPILSITITLMYALNIYNNGVDVSFINLNTDVIFVILDLVLLFTFIYVFTITYFKTKISLAKLCINIIKEYELDI